MRRISLPGSDGADGGKDFLCKGNHKPAEQAQEALGSLAGVMALDRHADLDNTPAEDNNADSLDRGKDKVRQVVDHRDRVAAGGKGGGAEADNAEREDAPHGHEKLGAFGSGFLHMACPGQTTEFRYKPRQRRGHRLIPQCPSV